MKILAVVLVAASCLLMTACGGGSSTTKVPDSSKVATATLPATLPAPRIISGAVQTGGQTSYTIKDGDTLAGIAERFGVTLDDLRAANPGVDPQALRTGQSIRLPAAPEGEAPTSAATAPPATATPAEAPTEVPVTDTPAPVTPTSLGQTYTVQSGDIPATIAAKFGVTVEALLAANPGIDPTNLQVGDVLIIPPAPTPAG